MYNKNTTNESTKCNQSKRFCIYLIATVPYSRTDALEYQGHISLENVQLRWIVPDDWPIFYHTFYS